MLQRLEFLKQVNCISWGPHFTPERGTGLQDGLLQPDQQLHQGCTLQIRVSKDDGAHRGASIADAGVNGMLDLSVLMKEHAHWHFEHVKD